MIDPDLYSVAQCERFSPAGAKNICRVSNFNYFSIKSGKKKADISQRVGFLTSDIVHSSGVQTWRKHRIYLLQLGQTANSSVAKTIESSSSDLVEAAACLERIYRVK